MYYCFWNKGRWEMFVAEPLTSQEHFFPLPGKIWIMVMTNIDYSVLGRLLYTERCQISKGRMLMRSQLHLSSLFFSARVASALFDCYRRQNELLMISESKTAINVFPGIVSSSYIEEGETRTKCGVTGSVPVCLFSPETILRVSVIDCVPMKVLFTMQGMLIQ